MWKKDKDTEEIYRYTAIPFRSVYMEEVIWNYLDLRRNKYV